MDLSNIGLHWSNRKIQFIVSDPQGITFITTQPKWLYQSIKPLSTETLKQIHLSQRYTGIDLKNMDINILRSISSHSSIVKIMESTGKTNKDYFTIQTNIADAGWDVMILAPLTELKKNQLYTIIVLTLLVILSLLISFLIWQRLKRQHEREHFQQEAQKQLEHQVAVRTTDLTYEIDKHKRTEMILRDTAA